MRNSTSKGSSSRFAELLRSGMGVRAVKLTLCAALLAATAGAQRSADWRIDTIAGTGERDFGGDGGPAVQAQLDFPYGVAADGAGNVYIADSGNHRIRKVDATGTITTFAGSAGFRGGGLSGDGGPAVQAHLSYPSGVAADGAGNVYIADSTNHRIRKVDPSGVITTIAGNGPSGGSGSYGGDGGPAVDAQLSFPFGVVVDSAGNLYIADAGNRRIRKIDSTGTITTIAGTGEFGFSGNGGPAVEAEISNPYGVAVDGAGNLYIADYGNHRIRKVDVMGMITTFAGITGLVRRRRERGFGGDGGPAVAALLNSPAGVAVDRAGNLYIADQFNNRIRKVDTSGTITTIAGNGPSGDHGSYGGDGGPAVDAQLYFPHDVTVDGAGNFFIADSSNHRIRILTPMQTEDQIYYFPHLAVGASWQTTITYINYSPAGGDLPNRVPFRSGNSADGLVCRTGNG